jgi:hypothetical protein
MGVEEVRRVREATIVAERRARGQVQGKER